MKLFRYSPKDAYLILYTLVTLSIPFGLWLLDLNLATLLICIPIYSIVVLNGQNSALHYHTHWPTFNNKRYNEVYEIVASMAYLLPQQWWKYAHMLHHRYNNDNANDKGECKDPASIFYYSRDGKPRNFWKYSVEGGFYISYGYLFGSPWYIEKVQKITQRLKYEQHALRVFIAMMFLMSVKIGLFVLLSFVLACMLNQAVSYGLHWGQIQFRGDTTRDSHSSYNKFYNFISFNCGYHQEHHHKPGVHWSRLPTEVFPLIPKDRKTYALPAIFNNPFWSHLIELVNKK